MKKCAEVNIRKVGNGFILTPIALGLGALVDNSNILVFNEKGQRGGNQEKELLAFLAEHFTEEPED